ncbi:MAG: YkgJ family cysteine cluster protein, partial [Phycisphaerae bacterium]|nr:YkgJ family cysteine cluster protein [Phycisphaerae bacterium]
MCGNCCTGPEGVVLFTADEGRAMADKVGMPESEFLAAYSRRVAGTQRSLKEKKTEFGNDCVFLDRQTIPGKAVCGLYEARPAQCRT